MLRRIVCARYPRLSGAVGGGVFIRPSLDSRLALARRGPPLPLHRSCFGVAGLEEARVVQMIAADADQDVIADDDGRNGGGVVELGIGDLHFPALLAGAGVQADELAIGRFKEQPVAVHPDAAVADGAAGVGWILIMPQLASR